MLILFILFSQVSLAQNNPVIVLEENEPLDEKAGCWITLYEEKDLGGSHLTYFNETNIPDLEYSVGPYWNEKLKSLTVGSTGMAYLYSRENYQGKTYTVPPATNLSPLPWEEVKSVKLRCLSRQEQKQRAKK